MGTKLTAKLVSRKAHVQSRNHAFGQIGIASMHAVHGPSGLAEPLLHFGEAGFAILHAARSRLRPPNQVLSGSHVLESMQSPRMALGEEKEVAHLRF